MNTNSDDSRERLSLLGLLLSLLALAAAIVNAAGSLAHHLNVLLLAVLGAYLLVAWARLVLATLHGGKDGVSTDEVMDAALWGFAHEEIDYEPTTTARFSLLGSLLILLFTTACLAVTAYMVVTTVLGLGLTIALRLIPLAYAAGAILWLLSTRAYSGGLTGSSIGRSLGWPVHMLVGS